MNKLSDLLSSSGLGLPTPAQIASRGLSVPTQNTLSTTVAQSGLGILGLPTLRQAEPVIPWAYVTDRFKAFNANLLLTDNQKREGITKFNGLVSCLNAAYLTPTTQTDAFMIGSWAKDTCIRPPRDVDMYYVLPTEVYYRYEAYSPGVNKQSALLQEVKGKLLASYPRSVIKGDGPIVLADFHGSTVEIAPAFLWDANERSYLVCDTKNGGRYMMTKPFDEVDAVTAADTRTNLNARPLIRMLKCWQGHCNVPIKSFHLELLAIEFLAQWRFNSGGLFYYDWMCRDFFQWVISRANGAMIAPGTYDIIWLDDAWKTRAESACGRATKACEFERDNQMLAAGDEWQKIFGIFIPRSV